jgi:hypothetical protein
MNIRALYTHAKKLWKCTGQVYRHMQFSEILKPELSPSTVCTIGQPLVQ